jgi:type I restriction enzyme, S subunit
MSSEAVRQLRDFVSLVRGTTYKGELVGNPGPVLLGLASIQPDGGFRRTSFKTYGGECPEKITLGPGELYVSLKDVTQSGDLLGSVARVPEDITAGRLTQDTVKLDFHDSEVNRSYIYWLLRTPEYRSYCRARATGTTTLGLARDDFLDFPVPEAAQVELDLVALLEAVEARIAGLRETNATLEAIAKALFKSWFVDFDPVHAKMAGRAPEGMDEATAALFPDALEETELGLVPKGWRSGCLSDIATTFKKAIAPSDLRAGVNYVGLEHIPRKSLALTEWGDAAELESNKAAFNKGDILFGKLRPYFHKVVVTPISGVCSTDILVCQPTQAEHRGLATMYLFSEALITYADRLSNGAKMPRVNWSDLAKFPISVPSIEISRAYTDAIEPLLSRMTHNTHAARTLASLRDSLLPRLISGQLRLPEAQAQKEGAFA